MGGSATPRVTSSPLPVTEQVDGVGDAVLMVFDTLVGNRHLVTGITVGEVVSANVFDTRVSPVGQHIIQVMAAHLQRNGLTGAFVVAGVANRLTAPKRVADVLRKAAQEDASAVLLVCVDARIYDAAFPALNVDFKLPGQQPN